MVGTSGEDRRSRGCYGGVLAERQIEQTEENNVGQLWRFPLLLRPEYVLLPLRMYLRSSYNFPLNILYVLVALLRPCFCRNTRLQCCLIRQTSIHPHSDGSPRKRKSIQTKNKINPLLTLGALCSDGGQFLNQTTARFVITWTAEFCHEPEIFL